MTILADIDLEKNILRLRRKFFFLNLSHFPVKMRIFLYKLDYFPLFLIGEMTKGFLAESSENLTIDCSEIPWLLILPNFREKLY